jgi:hypothetical protein
MKASKLAVFIAVVVVIAAGIIWRWTIASREMGPRPMEVAELVLTKAWTGEVVSANKRMRDKTAFARNLCGAA